MSLAPLLARPTRLQLYYGICLASITMVYLVCAFGILVSFRPGLPSISRIIADNPDFIPILYIIFVLCMYELRTLAALHHQTHKAKIRPIVMGLLQCTGFILIAVTDLDYMPVIHVLVAVVIITATLMREMDFSHRAFTLTTLGLCMLTAFAAVYIVCLFAIPDVESKSYISLLEYALFMMVPALGAHNMRHMEA